MMPSQQMEADQKVIGRPYFEDAAEEEPARLYLSRVAVFLEQQAADQKTGKNEKEIDALAAE